MIEVKIVQDFESDWYWIPKDKVKRFEEVNEDLSGMEYMDNPEFFDKFTDDYDVYRTGGDKSNTPLIFKNKTTKIII